MLQFREFDPRIPRRDQIHVLRYHLKRFEEMNAKGQLGSLGMAKYRGYQTQLEALLDEGNM